MTTTHRFDTLAVHAGYEPDPATGAVMPPIHLATTFAQQGPGVHRGFEYARTDNPTRRLLERCLADLEGARFGLCFSSGCAALATVLHTLGPGDHVVCGDDVYGGTHRLLRRVMEPLGVGADFVDLTEPRRLREAMTPRTKMVWIESPTNPLLKVLDIAALAEIAHAAGARLGVDNTFATPALQRPLELGADLVLHSTTKYLNGHSDVVGGFVATNDEALAERLRFLQNAIGAVPSPFDCFLVLRGVRTLPVRMRRHCESATQLALWLAAHPAVERVHYPGLPSHPGHALACRQMRAPGGMISFVVRGGLPAARALLESTRLFTCAESLGGVESLIESPPLMTHGSIPAAERERVGIVDGLVRVSVGLEDVDDLRDDLAHALEVTSRGAR
ncbi:MAG: cystathionine gamma-synthase [Myxococcota bacterium]|nr:cystathionine gamma-synthase [Myxococcota bacterium]MDW8362691.1 cystathionine gamma-synthase [Myxococcales bacterium]